MIADLKTYPAMKDSGVEWLGEVPEHWEVWRLRNVADMRVSNVDKHVKETETPVRLCNYVDVYKNDRISQQMNFMPATATTEEIERFLLEEGDVLITKDSETWDDIGVPALVTEPAPDLISGYHLALLRPCADELAGGYLLRALQSKGLAYQFHVEAKGVTRYGLSHASIKSVWLPLPPLPEQAAIVRYLDHVDRRVRRYVRAKQKLIGLLEELKQAIIHRAVTCGLDPDMPLKDSGVEWLGEVPEHWEVKRLKCVAGVYGRLVDPRLEQHRFKLLIAPNHIERNGTARLLKREAADEQGADSGKYEVQSGEIIYTKIRPYLRKATIAPVRCLCSADMYPISVHVDQQLAYEFLLLVMLSLPFTQYTVDCSLRAAMPKVNREALGKAPVWFPPPSPNKPPSSHTSTRPPPTSILPPLAPVAKLNSYASTAPA